MTVQLDFEHGTNDYENLSHLQSLNAEKLKIEVNLLPDLSELAKKQWRFSIEMARVLIVEADCYQLKQLISVVKHPDLHIQLNENPSVDHLKELALDLASTENQVQTLTCRIKRHNVTFPCGAHLWEEIQEAVQVI